MARSLSDEACRSRDFWADPGCGQRDRGSTARADNAFADGLRPVPGAETAIEPLRVANCGQVDCVACRFRLHGCTASRQVVQTASVHAVPRSCGRAVRSFSPRAHHCKRDHRSKRSRRRIRDAHSFTGSRQCWVPPVGTDSRRRRRTSRHEVQPNFAQCQLERRVDTRTDGWCDRSRSAGQGD